MVQDSRERLADDRPLDAPGSTGLTTARAPDPHGSARDPADFTTAPDGAPLAAQPAWRQDFPIDRSADEFVARRDFAKFLVLTSGAFVAGQTWIAAQYLLQRNRPRPEPRRIAAVAEVPVGAARMFAYPAEQDHCLLIRAAPETFVAFSQACTHLSCAVVPSFAEGKLLCPCHEGHFDLLTGRNLAGPPPRPLPRILLEVRGGDIYAVGVEPRTS